MSSINLNLSSLNTQRNLSASQNAVGQGMQHLSSGLRVNSSKDDAAGLAIAERIGSQAKGMNVAMRNANDAVSLAQTAEGALGKVSDMLQRMRELALQASNGSNNAADRANLDAEFQQVGQEISRTLAGARFNDKNILGADAGTLSFQVGASTGASDSITITTARLDNHATITAVTTGSLTLAGTALLAVDHIDAAINLVVSERANLGAAQGRFESAITLLQVSAEKSAGTRSRIVDADFASETASLSRAQVLQQAGTAMLAQANQTPNQVLTLLR